MKNKKSPSNVLKEVTGSEALAYGALEAGVHLVTGYPGSPATATVEAIQRLAGAQTQVVGAINEKSEADAAREVNRLLSGAQTQVVWAINEKSAADAALGVSLAGGRALLCVKSPGLNVALDCLMVANLAPGDGGFVILTGDDPGGWGSQSEEDSRPIVQALELPMLEPSSVPQARELMCWAFELSERQRVPVVVRITRAFTAERGVISELHALAPSGQPKQFRRQPDRWTVLPIHVVSLHQRLQAVLAGVQTQFEGSAFNHVEGEGRLGVIAAGHASQKFEKVWAASDRAPLRVLRLGTLFPLPAQLVANFLSGLDAVLVVEELAPFIETHVQAAAQRAGLTLPIYGRASGHLPGAGELFDPEIVQALARFLPQHAWPGFGSIAPTMPSRQSLCDGCPYIPAFDALLAVLERRGGRDHYVITGETGCLVRGQLPPWQILDIKYSMGSSIGIATGLWRAGIPQKLIALSGDSAFLHSGLGELIDAGQAGVDLLVVLLDNDKTALTGGQPHPGTRQGRRALSRSPVELAKLVRAAGVDFVRVIDPEDAQVTQAAFEDGLQAGGVSVVIVQKPCPRYVE